MEVNVLGSLEVAVDGARIDVTSSTQRRIISALVALRGEVVSSERLADMAEMSLRALRTAVSRLRARLGEDVIVTQPGGYTLGAAVVDADRFEAHLAKARDAAPADALAALDSALSLWRGEPYADCGETEWAAPFVRAARRAVGVSGRGTDCSADCTGATRRRCCCDGRTRIPPPGARSTGRVADASARCSGTSDRGAARVPTAPTATP